jgi:hypothetical protein
MADKHLPDLPVRMTYRLHSIGLRPQCQEVPDFTTKLLHRNDVPNNARRPNRR